MTMSETDPEHVEAEPSTEPEDPFLKIPFNPRKGAGMIAPIRFGVLKEIVTVDQEDELTGNTEH